MADDIFKSLQETAEAFLRNMDKVNEQASTKDQLRQRGLVSNPVPDDTFGKGLDRLKRLRAARPVVEPTATTQELMKSYLEPEDRKKLEQTTSSTTTSVPSQPASAGASTQDTDANATPPQNIFERMKQLSTRLGKVYVIDPSPTWTELDTMSATIRKSLAVSLTQRQKDVLQDVLPSLWALAGDVSVQASSWGIHGNAWSEWAQKWRQELPQMSKWLNISLSPFLVPEGFKAPSTLPSLPQDKAWEQVVTSLQECDQFVQWWMQEGQHWSNTAAYDAFVNLQQQVQNMPSTQDWKEDILDWLSIQQGRLALEENRRQSPVPQGPKLK